MKLSEWMGAKWEGELPFDPTDGGTVPTTFGDPASGGAGGSREATRLRVFVALSVMGAGGQIGVYTYDGPYGRRGLSLGEAFAHAEMRGTAGGFALANGPGDREWLERAAAEEIALTMKDAGFERTEPAGG